MRPIAPRCRSFDRCCRSTRAIRRSPQLDPKLRRAGIFEAITQFLHAASEARPLIVVLEDLHWMDQATGEFLAMMTESLMSDRILLCATHRSGTRCHWRKAPFGTQLTLSRVSRSDTGAIGCSLLGASALSVELQQLLDDKTDGNPFFVEEVLRSLQERGLLERQGDEIGLVRPIGEDRHSRQRSGCSSRTSRAARSRLA